jgi:uncharacterized protein (DUF885 family)
MNKKLLSLLIAAVITCSFNPQDKFRDFTKRFAKEWLEAGIPEFTYDYREYFNTIPDQKNIDKQLMFFHDYSHQILQFDRGHLIPEQQIVYDHISYEIAFNITRLKLEKQWTKAGRRIPLNGLYSLSNYKEWYTCFIQKFTSLDTSPEEIMSFGLEEVKRVNHEIDQIRIRNGFRDMDSFYKHLNSDHFYFTDKTDILKAFAHTDSCVRANLKQFAGKTNIPEIYPMEWPEAGQFTPPGIYLNKKDNAYGKDVFQYNFYGGKYNKRAIDWIYMHEGIPGHHLQSTLRENNSDEIQALFLYPGNFEGWACYVEYFGKELGVYADDYSYLGKWEWDLIRSGRLVLETGIHYFGWSKEKALEFWKANIYGQDEIAEREVTRVTNWPGQALTYKLGAKFIFDLRSKIKSEFVQISEADFNRCLLNFGMRPLPVIEKNISKIITTKS